MDPNPCCGCTCTAASQAQGRGEICDLVRALHLKRGLGERGGSGGRGEPHHQETAESPGPASLLGGHPRPLPLAPQGDEEFRPKYPQREQCRFSEDILETLRKT